jgi:HEXXH motif-containing protein
MNITSEAPLLLVPPWPLGMPATLAAEAERHWLTPKNLDRNTYSTENILGCNVSTHLQGSVPMDWYDRLQDTADITKQLLSRLCLNPVALSITDALDVRKVLRQADALLSNLPEVHASAQAFVRAIHLIESTGPDYDCSFSDPQLPFTIFVSIPSDVGKQRELRVMEAVVHECMHLQLSAFENLTPLVRPESDEVKWHSPWKKEQRKLQGILHGMYVFHVVSYMYSNLLKAHMLVNADAPFARRRLEEIAGELGQVRGVEASPGLTEAGARLASTILNGVAPGTTTKSLL